MAELQEFCFRLTVATPKGHPNPFLPRVNAGGLLDLFL
jgi:hypothetical protein